MVESYNKENGKRYGIKAAIILEKLIYFTASNIITKQHEHENRTHVKIKNGVQGFAKILEFSPSQIRYNLNKLERAGAIQRTNAYNRNKYDKTHLYYVEAIHKDEILKKVNEILNARKGKQEETPAPASPPSPRMEKPKQEETPAPSPPSPPSPAEMETPAPSPASPQMEREQAVIKIFNLYYKDIYKTNAPPANKHTTAAAAEIYNAIIKDIEAKTGKAAAEHGKKAIINQIEWYFYTASKIYKNELLKFNLIYLKAAKDNILSKLHTFANKHYNKNDKFKRRFFINLNELL